MNTSIQVRVITDGGELCGLTDHGDDEQAAWADFAALEATALVDTTVQFIRDGLVEAEHHGTTEAV